MNWKTCSVEAGAGISNRRLGHFAESELPATFEWDAKTRVDDVYIELL
jgi:hypothetical protein